MQLQAMDRFSNPRIRQACTGAVKTDCDPFAVYFTPVGNLDSCKAAANSRSPEPADVVPVDSTADGKYDVSMTLLVAATYNVTIRLGGGDIVGSPFVFDASAGPVDAAKVRGHRPCAHQTTMK